MPVKISLDVFPRRLSPRITGYFPVAVGSIREAMVNPGAGANQMVDGEQSKGERRAGALAEAFIVELRAYKGHGMLATQIENTRSRR